MTARPTPAIPRLVAGLLAALLLLAACGSAAPSSDLRTAPPDVASEAPASEAPASAEPASAPPTDAPPPTATAKPPKTPPPGPPDRPAKVTWKQVGSTQIGTGTRVTYRLTWQAPSGVATEFRVYGVTSCLRESKKYDNSPCVVKGMKIPRSTLKLLATVPGDLRTVDVSWKLGESGPPPYFAVLLRASNKAGDSIFAIAHSEDVCWGCTY